MLRTLHVRNLAVLADVELEFGDGLNVLTGETGAGKSIVVDSLALLAGARASTELIRSGSDALSVAGVFSSLGAAERRLLEAAGLEADEDQLVVRREVHREASNRVFVNDQPVTLRLLAELTSGLLRIHTQREELGLLAPEVQRAWLDRSGGAAAWRGSVATSASGASGWTCCASSWARSTTPSSPPGRRRSCAASAPCCATPRPSAAP